MKGATGQFEEPIKGIYAVYSYDGGAAGQAVQASGSSGKITIVSDDGEASTVSDVKSGLIAASILQRPYYQGYMLAYVLAADKVLGDAPRTGDHALKSHEAYVQGSRSRSEDSQDRSAAGRCDLRSHRPAASCFCLFVLP